MQRDNKGRFIKGHSSYERTPHWRKSASLRLKNNPLRFWLGKKRPDMEGHPFWGPKELLDFFKTHKFKGKDNKNWKGSKVGYAALHHWVYRELGFPNECEECGIKSESHRKIHWANISHKYKRDLNDWKRLCAKCHWQFDRGGQSA